MPKVKICGMTNLEDALKAHEFGADLVGFIFFQGSPRRIDAEKAKAVIEGLPKGLLKVGLFLNQDLDYVRQSAERCGLDMLQLHGDEDPDYCAGLAKDFKIIKSFRVKKKIIPEDVDRYDEAADFYLFDTYVKDAPGGTGKVFNWSVLSRMNFKKPIFLAGGLKAENVKRAIEEVKPYAVDVASGVEKSPGIKDYKLMKEFIENVKSAG